MSANVIQSVPFRCMDMREVRMVRSIGTLKTDCIDEVGIYINHGYCLRAAHTFFFVVLVHFTCNNYLQAAAILGYASI